MSQNNQKTTLPSQPLGGMELQAESAGNLQVVRPGPAAGQLPQGQSNQQLGQGIVAPHLPQRPAAPAHNHPEDIATFFQNRQMVIQGSRGVSPVLKFFVFFCVVTGSFILAWNYIGQFRKKSQALAEMHLGVSLADYVPVWTKRAKKFEHSVDKEIAARPVSQRPGAATAAPIDPLYLSVVSGFWPQVESHIANKCITWDATPACSLRAWYSSYKGLRSSLRPILRIKPELIQKLSLREQAVFRFAMASASDGAATEKLFLESLSILGQDSEFSRLLFDARYKQVLRDNHQAELPSLIKMANSKSSGPSDLAKWRMMGIAARVNSSPSGLTADQKRTYAKQTLEILQKYPGVFKSDPLAFISIANLALRLGLARHVSSVAGPLADDALKVAMDTTLRREIFVVLARALMLEGDATRAEQKIKTTQSKDGPDGVTNHLLGSLYLEMRSGMRLFEAINSFQAAIKARNAWQSEIGLLTALIRAGKLKDAGRVAGVLSTAKNKENEAWVLLALAQYKLAVAGSSGSPSPARYKEIVDSIAGLHSKNPDWPGLAKVYADALAGAGQNAEVQKIRMSIDDMASKTSYLSSTEFLESPIGPFGLMR